MNKQIEQVIKQERWFIYGRDRATYIPPFYIVLVLCRMRRLLLLVNFMAVMCVVYMLVGIFFAHEEAHPMIVKHGAII